MARVHREEGRTDALTATAAQFSSEEHPYERRALSALVVRSPLMTLEVCAETTPPSLLNNAQMAALESGQYVALYEKWLGPTAAVPYPLTAETKRFLLLQVVPK